VNRRPASYELRPFERLHAPLIASWVRDDDELFWLAPQTPPPVTPEKVIGWTIRRGRPLLLWPPEASAPIGYAELNDMPTHPDELWIGHFIIALDHRGLGLSREMLRLLLRRAFGPLRAERVALIVFPANEPAIRCYRSGGLRTVGFQERTFASRPGPHKMREMAIDRMGYDALIRGSDETSGSR